MPEPSKQDLNSPPLIPNLSSVPLPIPDEPGEDRRHFLKVAEYETYTIDDISGSLRQQEGAVMSLKDFFEQACYEARLLLRNTPQYLADAIVDYGYVEKESYGRKIKHYLCLEAPWLPNDQKQKMVPRDCDDVMECIVAKLQEGGRQIRLEQGIIFRGIPGSGKDILIDRLNETFEDYSRNHSRGALWRLAFRFDSERECRRITGFDTVQHSSDDSRGYLIPSPLNCNPATVLSNRRPSNAELSDRERFVNSCHGDFNHNYVLADVLDPMSARILKALAAHYKNDLKAALNAHAVAERWFFSQETGEGIYVQLPYVEPNSMAVPLFKKSPFGNQYVPDPLYKDAQQIPSIKSPYLGANVIYLEDVFADNMRDKSDTDLARLGHLLAFNERGKLQLHSDEFFLTVTKDAVVFASANDDHIRAKQHSKTWEPLSKRFSVIGVPAIRQFREEIEAHKDAFYESIGPQIAIAPHVLEVLCLFLVSTRLLNPQSSYYDQILDKTDESLGKIAEKLAGIRKALFFQSSEFQDRHTDLNFKAGWPQLSATEINILRENEQIIKNEYLHDINKMQFDIYDGGFGISTRDAKTFFQELADFTRGRKYMTLLDVYDVLRLNYEAGFDYYTNFDRQKKEILKRLYMKACADENVEYVEPAELANDRRSDAAKLYNRVREKVEKMFPITAPDVLLQEVQAYGRYKVQSDLRRLLKFEDIHFRVKKYIYHLVSYRNEGRNDIPAKYRTIKPEFAKPGDPLEKAGVDVNFMHALEDEILGKEHKHAERLKFQDETFFAYTNWKETHSGTPLEEVIDDIFKVQKFDQMVHTLKDAARQKENKKLIKFWELSVKYMDNKAALDMDLLDDRTCQETREWKKIWDGLIETGYPEESIMKHIKWAFSEELKGR